MNSCHIFQSKSKTGEQRGVSGGGPLVQDAPPGGVEAAHCLYGSDAGDVEQNLRLSCRAGCFLLKECL